MYKTRDQKCIVFSCFWVLLTLSDRSVVGKKVKCEFNDSCLTFWSCLGHFLMRLNEIYEESMKRGERRIYTWAEGGDR